MEMNIKTFANGMGEVPNLVNELRFKHQVQRRGVRGEIVYGFVNKKGIAGETKELEMTFHDFMHYHTINRLQEDGDTENDTIVYKLKLEEVRRYKK